MNPVNNFHNKELIWNIKTYNKRDDFKINFNLVAFPHASSNIQRHNKTGAVIGQLHSYATTNYINLSDFLRTVNRLFPALITTNKYNYNSLYYIFKKFVYSKGTLYFTKANKILQKFHATKHLYVPTTMSQNTV